MNKEKAVSTSLIPVLQDILTAPEPDSLLHASHALNACLVTSPVEQILAQSGQFIDLAEQHLMDAVENGMGGVSEHTRRECETAYRDYQRLCRPVLPMPVLTPTARTVLGIVEELGTLTEYDLARKEMWGYLQALDDGEREAVSGHISRQLAGLLIRMVLPELVCQMGNPVLNRQYDLWSQLSDCRQRGLDSLAVYFLRIRSNHVQVLLPPAMSFYDDADACRSCARTLSVLYYQLPVCQRKELFHCLLDELENVVTKAVLDGQNGKDAEVIRDLYLAMRAAEQSGRMNYWEMVCFAMHTIHETEEET